MDNERYTIGWLKEDYRKRFEWLYKTMYRQMAVFARNFLRDDDLAEDMVQEVFANLWTKGKEMRDDIVLEPYLQTAIKNLCIDYLRKLNIADKYQQHVLSTEAISYTPEEEEEPERVVKLREAMKELPEMQRQVLELSAVEGLKYKEIAERLNIAEGTVHTHVKRAYKVIKTKLAGIGVLLFMIFN